MTDNKVSNAADTPQYEVEIPSREALLEAVTAQLKPITFEQLIARFQLADERQHEGMKRRLRAMERDGQLVYTKANAYGLPERMELLQGRVIGHKDGFGFIQLDQGGPDLFIPHHQMYSVMHGDKVLVKEHGTDARGRREGRIVRVLQSRDGDIVGRFFVEHDLGIVVPDDGRINQDILIPEEARNGARHGQIVVVRITKRPNRRTSPLGAVVEVLGEHMAPGMEIEVAIREHDIPTEWSPAAIAEAEKFGAEVPAEAYEGREDLRELPLITIDGEDSRDFDDAVYAEAVGDGWKLLVAIADVSYYVRPNTPLDKEALARGNSVYFPNHVVPMLPEALSNGLCSLNPDVDRLCMVTEMHIDKRGEQSKVRCYPAVMRSHARLTYTKVTKMIEGDPKLRQQYDAVLGNIDTLHSLYKVLKKSRQQRGAIEFETTETRFIFNAQRKIERIEPVRRHVAHMLIEECMIAANVATGRLIEADEEMAALFRVHQSPSEEKLVAFRAFLAELGLQLNGGVKPEPSDYRDLLAAIGERPDHELIQTMLLRSMQQAVYSPDNEGHFGLALSTYAHFTSPIRRYPDLILHRALKAQLKKQQGPLPSLEGAFAYTDKDLDGLGVHCSMTERRADDATRQVDEWLKCEFMLDHVGMEFNGVIASVTSFGLFIRLDDMQIDGLVHISNLDNDYYHFDDKRHLLIGENSRCVYRLGDAVKVRVRGVNLDDRKIDLDLLAATSPTGEARFDPDQPKRSGKPTKRGRGAGKHSSPKAGANKTGANKSGANKPGGKSSSKGKRKSR